MALGFFRLVFSGLDVWDRCGHGLAMRYSGLEMSLPGREGFWVSDSLPKVVAHAFLWIFLLDTGVVFVSGYRFGLGSLQECCAC